MNFIIGIDEYGEKIVFVVVVKGWVFKEYCDVVVVEY